MHEHAVAADILAHLATEPGREESIGSLATLSGRSVEAVGAACELLKRWSLIDDSVTGAVRLPPVWSHSDQPVILIVENTVAVAHLVGALLDSEGYRVLIAGTLDIGRRVLESVPIDLVVADSFSDTARDALNRLSVLRDANGSTPVMIFTAHRDLDDERAKTEGFAGVLRKPFDIDDLLARVSSQIMARRTVG